MGRPRKHRRATTSGMISSSPVERSGINASSWSGFCQRISERRSCATPPHLRPARAGHQRRRPSPGATPSLATLRAQPLEPR
jgi:hypothetical protein